MVGAALGAGMAARQERRAWRRARRCAVWVFFFISFYDFPCNISLNYKTILINADTKLSAVA